MISRLPSINASLNLLSAVLLATGYRCIRQRRIKAHRICMLSAFGASILFLISYVVYHLHVGHVHYLKGGLLRIIYISLLTSHTILAMVIVPLVLRTLYLALKSRFESHRRWARWTLPLWFYVNVTGVII